MAQTILYYPNIDIQDGQWLRNAILYWDKVATIVPYDNYPDFSPEVLYLKELDLYEPIFPQSLFHSEYATDFANAIVRRMGRYKSLNNRIDYNPPTARIHKDKIYAPALHELIHYKKIPDVLYDYLIDQKYISNYNYDGWMEVDSKFISVYMRTFAEYVAKCSNEDMVIGTDEASKQFDIYNRTPPSSNRFCFSLIMQRCLPQPTMDIGFEEILVFKEKRKGDLLAFRERVRTFEKKLSQCQSPEELKAEVEAFKECWQREMLQADKLFKGDRISYVWGSMRALVDASAAATGIDQGIRQYTSGHNPAWLFGAAVGVASLVGVGSCYVNYKNKLNEHRNGSGFAYLIRANQNGVINKEPFYEML